jgi:hypothetical protein
VAEKVKHLTEAQIDSLFWVIRSPGGQSHLPCRLSQGLRAHEICMIQLSDFNPERQDNDVQAAERQQGRRVSSDLERRARAESLRSLRTCRSQEARCSGVRPAWGLPRRPGRFRPLECWSVHISAEATSRTRHMPLRPMRRLHVSGTKNEVARLSRSDYTRPGTERSTSMRHSHPF